MYSPGYVRSYLLELLFSLDSYVLKNQLLFVIKILNLVLKVYELF